MNLPRKDWFGETKRAANFVHCLLGKDIIHESMTWLSVNCGEGSIVTWVLGSFVLVLFLKINSVMMVLKRNSKIIPYISKHHFQLNLTLGRVGKGHSDEEEITGKEELKLSQKLCIIRIKI